MYKLVSQLKPTYKQKKLIHEFHEFHELSRISFKN